MTMVILVINNVPILPIIIAVVVVVALIILHSSIPAFRIVFLLRILLQVGLLMLTFMTSMLIVTIQLVISGVSSGSELHHLNLNWDMLREQEFTSDAR